MSELSITVFIAERPYKLKIKSEEEENIRKAAQILNGEMKGYSSQYSFKDKQDLLAMVGLEYVNNYLKSEGKLAFFDQNMIDKLNEIDGILEQSLSKS